MRAQDAAAPVHLNRDFRVLWLARTLGMTGGNAAQAGTLILVVQRSESGWLPSLLVLAWVLPSTCAGVVSGVVVDRVPKQGLLFVANALRAGACFLVAASGRGTEDLFALAAVLAALAPFVGPAESALVPTLVGREQLTGANAFLNLLRYLSQAAGLAVLAPALIRTGSDAALWAVIGALFTGAAVYAPLIPTRRPFRVAGGFPVFPDEPARARRGGLREALHFLLNDPRAWRAGVQLALLGATLPLIVAVLPVYLRDVLDQRPSDLPLLLLPAVLGMLMGLRLVSGLARRRGREALGNAGLALIVAALALLAGIDGVRETVGGALGLRRADLGVIDITAKAQVAMVLALSLGLGVALVGVSTTATLNACTPLKMQGRVFALQGVLAGVASVPPLLVGGALTEVVDVRVVAGLTPVLLISAWLWAWRRPVLLRRPPFRSAEGPGTR